MDLRLYLRVISRFWYLVLAGLILAVALAFLSMFKVGQGGISYRQNKTYQAAERLLLTKKNCPYCTGGGGDTDFGTAAVLYSEIANSGVVRGRMLRNGPINGSYVANPISGGSSVGILPLIDIVGFADTPRGASRIASRASQAFEAYLTTNQSQAEIPEDQRVLVQTITRPTRAVVAKDRKLTVPIVIFLSVLIVTLGLAFILENLRPRPAPVREVERPAGSAGGDEDLEREVTVRAPESRRTRV